MAVRVRDMSTSQLKRLRDRVNKELRKRTGIDNKINRLFWILRGQAVMTTEEWGIADERTKIGILCKFTRHEFFQIRNVGVGVLETAEYYMKKYKFKWKEDNKRGR